jgi:hypothetical protein
MVDGIAKQGGSQKKTSASEFFFAISKCAKNCIKDTCSWNN